MEGYISGVGLDDYDEDFTGTETNAPKLPDFNWEPSRPLTIVWPQRPVPNFQRTNVSRKSRFSTFRKSIFGGPPSPVQPTPAPSADSTLHVPDAANPSQLQDGRGRVTRLRENAYSNYFSWMPNNFTAVETPAAPNDPDQARRTTILVNDEAARPGSFYPQSRASSYYPPMRPDSQARPFSSFPDRESFNPTDDISSYYMDQEPTPPVPSIPAHQRQSRFRKPIRSAVVSFAPSLAPVPSSPTRAEGNWHRLSDSDESLDGSASASASVGSSKRSGSSGSVPTVPPQSRLSLATSQRPGSMLEVQPGSVNSPLHLRSPDSPNPNPTPIVPDNAHILTSRYDQELAKASGGTGVLRRSKAYHMQTQPAAQLPAPMEAQVVMAPVQETILVNWDGPDDPANPKNWPHRKRLMMTLIMAVFGFITPYSSSSLAPSLDIIAREFHVTNSTATSLLLSIFILGYAFGPLFWAPMSEIYGRTQILHIANWLFLMWTIGCSLAKSSTQMYVFRFLAGLCGSAPLGIGVGVLQDLWAPADRGKYMGLYTLGPLLGPALGPVVGGWIAETYQWRWSFRIVIIVDGLLLAAALFIQKETYAPKILYDKAEKLRITTGNFNYRTKFENTAQTTTKKLTTALARPVTMLFTQPIVVLLGVFMAYLYGLQYLIIGSFSRLWYFQYHESLGISGLNFIALGLGLITGAQLGSRYSKATYEWATEKYGNGVARPEFRIFFMFPGGILVPIGAFLYGWTAEYLVFWLVPDIGIFLVGFGTVLSFQSIQNYIVDTFALYAASAIAAAVALRSLAGFGFPLFSTYLYDALGYGWGNSLLGFVALALGTPCPFLLWFYGEKLRSFSTLAVEASKMKAMALSTGKMTQEEKMKMFQKMTAEEKDEMKNAGGFANLPPARKAELLVALNGRPDPPAGAGPGGMMTPEKKARLIALLTAEEKAEIAAAGGIKNMSMERKMAFMAKLNASEGSDAAPAPAQGGGMTAEKKAKLMALLTPAEKMEIAGAGGFIHLSPEKKAEYLARVNGTEPAPAAGGQGAGLSPEQREELMGKLSFAEKMEIQGAGGFKNLSPEKKAEFLARLDSAPPAAPDAAPAIDPETKAKLMAVLTMAEKLEIQAAGGLKGLPAERKAEFLAKVQEPEPVAAPAAAPGIDPETRAKLMAVLTMAEKLEVQSAGGLKGLSPERKAEFLAKIEPKPEPEAPKGVDPETRAKLMAVLTMAEKLEVQSAGGLKGLSPERKAEFLAKIEPKPEPEEPKPIDPETRAKLMAVLSMSEKLEIQSAGGLKGLSPERKAEFLARIEEPKPEPEPEAAKPIDPETRAKLMAVLSMSEKLEIQSAGGLKGLSPERKAEFLARIEEPKPVPEEPKPIDPETRAKLMAVLSMSEKLEIQSAGGLKGLSPERKAEFLARIEEPKPEPVAAKPIDPETRAKLMAVLSMSEKLEIQSAGGLKGLSPERKAEFLARIEEPKPEPEAAKPIDPETRAKLMAVLSMSEKLEIQSAGGLKGLPAERKAEFLARIEDKQAEPPALPAVIVTEPNAAVGGGLSPDQRMKLMAVLTPAEKAEIGSVGGFKNLAPARKAQLIAKLNNDGRTPSPPPAPISSGPNLTPEQKVKLMQILGPSEKAEVLAAGGIAMLSAGQKTRFLAKLDKTARSRSQSPASRASSSAPQPTSAFASSQDPFADPGAESSEDERSDKRRMLEYAESMGGLTESQKAKVEKMRKGGFPDAKKLGLSGQQKMKMAAAQIGGLTDEQKRRLAAAKLQGATSAARQNTLADVNEE